MEPFPLTPTLVPALRLVLGTRGMPSGEIDRLVRALAASPSPELVVAILVDGGKALIDGESDACDLLDRVGPGETQRILADRLSTRASLDPADATAIIEPMFDGLEIVQPNGGRLRAGARVTLKRFEEEAEWVIGRASRRALVGSYAPFGRYAVMGYPELATVDGEGRVPGSGSTFELGTFEVTSGTLRATDPAVFHQSKGQNDLPARCGAWRAESVIRMRDGWPCVAELRAWAPGHEPGVDEPMEDAGFMVSVDSGLAGLFDVTAATETDAAADDFAEMCGAPVHGSPARAALVKRFGVVASSGLGDGGYPCRILQDEDGSVVTVSLDFGW